MGDRTKRYVHCDECGAAYPLDHIDQREMRWDETDGCPHCGCLSGHVWQMGYLQTDERVVATGRDRKGNPL
jgi:NAD-dependent SIR2 family protein deacetylase